MYQPPTQQYQPIYQQPPKKRSRKPLVIAAALIFGIALVLLVIIIAAVATQPPATAQTTPTAQPTRASAITHGYPHIEGPISDFIGKYGKPQNGDQFSVKPFTLFSADATGGVVTHLIAIGGLNWSNSRTQSACAVFLPHGASQFNVDAQYIDYHSSAGEIVMSIAAGQCVLTTSQS